MKWRGFPAQASFPYGPLALWLLSACAAGEPLGAGHTALLGQDGDHTAAGSAEVVNLYSPLAADVKPGDLILNVKSGAALNLKAGDLVLIYQAQGATIDTTASAGRFGTVTSLGNAGHYELVTIDSVAGNTITLDAKCAVKNTYTAAGATQVVRVPQYSNLTVPVGTGLSAPAWDGTTGGIVAVSVANTAAINGSVDASGRGFRGGAASLNSLAFGMDTDTIASGNALSGGEKGESIAGGGAQYGNARYGRGAPANGGGGGSAHNASGGGGGGGDNGLAWSGAGVMDPNAVGAAAWKLDPATIANGGMLTNSSGGGRGGYSYATGLGPNNPDPLTVPPGDARWGGDQRRAVGGQGGHPLPVNPAQTAFFGGGGGGGSGNNDAAGSGSSGGGIVLVIAGTITGTGTLSANGTDAPNNTANFDDGTAGAGAGGTVIVSSAKPVPGLTLSAQGGVGGHQPNSMTLDTEHEAEGGGGGGGGGFIYFSAGQPLVKNAGGAAGSTAATLVSHFPVNGGTGGGSGAVAALPSLAICALSPTADMTGGGGSVGDGGADMTGASAGDGGAGSGDGGGGDGGDGGSSGSADLGGTGITPGHSFAGGGLTCSSAPLGGAAANQGAGAASILGLLGLASLVMRRARRSLSARG